MQGQSFSPSPPALDGYPRGVYNLIIKTSQKRRSLCGKKLDKDGNICDLKRDVHIPGDVTAQIFWLKNRRRQQWRDKVEYSNDGGEISKLDEILKEIKKDATE